MDRMDHSSGSSPGAGFSLVEVLVSCALLGVAAATVLSLLLQSGLNNLEARRAAGLAAVALVTLPNLDAGAEAEQLWCGSPPSWQAHCADDRSVERPRFRRVVRAVQVLEAGPPGESVELVELTVEVSSLPAGGASGGRTATFVTLRAP